MTKAKQWVRISPYLEICDTPGLLWPKLDDQFAARKLAYLGSIRDEIMPKEQLAEELLRFLMETVSQKCLKRYPSLCSVEEGGSYLEEIAVRRGAIRSGGSADLERAAMIVLDEFRSGRIGRITMDVISHEEVL